MHFNDFIKDSATTAALKQNTMHYYYGRRRRMKMKKMGLKPAKMDEFHQAMTMFEEKPVKTDPWQIGWTLSRRYQIFERVGIQNDAEVFLARDLNEDRIVTIKTAHKELWKGYLSGFAAKYNDLKGCMHPNLIHVYETGTAHGASYCVLEHVKGSTLKERMKSHQFIPWRTAVGYVMQILSVLDETQNRPFSDFNNIYPENIFLTENDQVKIELGQCLYKPRKYEISHQKMGQFKQQCDSESSAQFAMENGGFLFMEQNVTVEMLRTVHNNYLIGKLLYQMLTGRRMSDSLANMVGTMGHLLMPMDSQEIPSGLQEIICACVQSVQGCYPEAADLLTAFNQMLAAPNDYNEKALHYPCERSFEELNEEYRETLSKKLIKREAFTEMLESLRDNLSWELGDINDAMEAQQMRSWKLEDDKVQLHAMNVASQKQLRQLKQSFNALQREHKTLALKRNTLQSEVQTLVIDKQRLMKERAALAARVTALEAALEQERQRKQAARPVKFVSFHPVDDAMLLKIAKRKNAKEETTW